MEVNMWGFGLLCAICLLIYGVMEPKIANKQYKKYKEEEKRLFGEDPVDIVLNRLKAKE